MFNSFESIAFCSNKHWFYFSFSTDATISNHLVLVVLIQLSIAHDLDASFLVTLAKQDNACHLSIPGET